MLTVSPEGGGGGGDTYGGTEKPSYVAILIHDVKALRETVKNLENRVAFLAGREDISKLEIQLEKFSSEKVLLVRKEEFEDIKTQVKELSQDKEYLAGIKGTLGFIKFVVGLMGGIAVLLTGRAITLHHQDMELVYSTLDRVQKNDSKIEYITDHQIADLMAFRREIEETGSPILQATMRDLAGVKQEVKDISTEIRVLSNTIFEYSLQKGTDIKRSDKPPGF
jgi:hypothetical protein